MSIAPRYLRSLPWLLTACLIVLLTGLIGSPQWNRNWEREQRADIEAELQDLQAEMVAGLDKRIAVLDELSKLAEANTQLQQDQFGSEVHDLIGINGISYVSLAEDLTVSHTYPPQADLQGQDLLRDPRVQSAVQRALQTNRVTLAFTRSYSDESSTINAYKPIRKRTATGDFGQHYWGVAHIAFSVETVLQEAGLFDVYRNIELGVRGYSGEGDTFHALFGPRQLFFADTISLELPTPDGVIELAAMPRQGWGAQSFAERWHIAPGIAAPIGILLLMGVFVRWNALFMRLSPGIAAAAILVLCVALIWIACDRDARLMREQLQRDIEITHDAIQLRLENQRHYLEKLTRLASDTGEHSESWRLRSKRYLESQSEIIELYWLNTQLQPLQISTGEPVKTIPGELSVTIERVMRTRTAQYSRPSHDNSGFMAFLLAIPSLDSDGAVRGYLLALYSLEQLLRAGTPINVAQDYLVQVIDGGGIGLSLLNTVKLSADGPRQKILLKPLDYETSLQITRYADPAGQRQVYLLLLAALMLAVGVFLGLRHLQRRQDVLEQRIVDDAHKLEEAQSQLHVDTLKIRQIESQLRKSEIQCRSIFNASNEALLFVDLNQFCIVDANAAALSLLEFTRKQLLGMPLGKVCPDCAELTIQRENGHGSDRQLYKQTRFVSRGGRIRPAEITVSHVNIDGDKHLLIVARDLSHQSRRDFCAETAHAAHRKIKTSLLGKRDTPLDGSHQWRCFQNIIYQGESIDKLRNQVEQVAATASTVLIVGESGTGKGMVARAIHRLSARKDQPLITVNCAALPESLIESELFGHERGAFSGATARQIGRFELAHQGTLFLDEVGELPKELQTKLLRVLQDGEFERLGSSVTQCVDVRVIAATNRNLDTMRNEGHFRDDLFYRLNVFPVRCPPLRERMEDVPALVNHFVKKHSVASGKPIETVAEDTFNHLMSYDWPGNVRELENVIERAVILCNGSTLEIEQLHSNQPKIADSPDGKTLLEVEISMIRDALLSSNGVIEGPRGAAKALGMAPSTLRERMQRYNIPRRADVIVAS